MFKIIIIGFQNLKKHRLEKLFESLPDFEGLTLIDIGAAGGVAPRWREASRHINFIGFEPDLRSRESLMRQKSICKNYVIHPFAIWSSFGSIPIIFTSKPEVSSFFEPNKDFLRKFPKSDRFTREHILNVDCRTLDSFAIKDPDFIKLDIQGAELEALRGADITLSECLGIEIEVEFAEIYRGQPLFGDVSKFLSKMGFEFNDFLNLCRWERNAFSGLGQLVFGDALFLRTPEHFLAQNPTNRKISSYLAVLVLYNRYDLLQFIEENLSFSQKKQFKDFFKSFKNSKKAFVRIHKIVVMFNRLFRICNSESRLYLTH
jgi:FkbM family methyltransferase